MAAAIASESQTIFDILNLWSVFKHGGPRPPSDPFRFYQCTPLAEKPSYRCSPTQPPFPLKETADQRTVPIKALWPQAIDPMFLAYELGAQVVISSRQGAT
jgi:hypothetical protein